MFLAATLWVLASPFLVGAAIGSWRPANRFVARHHRPALLVGWLGVGLLLAAVFVCDGDQAEIAGLTGGPLAGLSFWSRSGGRDDDDDDEDPGDGPDRDVDWDEFARNLEDYVARDRRPVSV